MPEEIYKIVIGGYCVGYGDKADMEEQALDLPGARVLRMDEVVTKDNQIKGN